MTLALLAAMLDALRIFSERRHARRVSRDLMRWYEKLHKETPDIYGESLYRAILTRRNGLGEPAVNDVLRRAWLTFEWHSDRTLKFRDVALIVTFDECLRGHAPSTGVRADLGRIVARYIPWEL